MSELQKRIDLATQNFKIGTIHLDAALAEAVAIEEENKDLKRRLKSHSIGESVSVQCSKCLKLFWHVDDEPIRCPHCLSDDMPITAEQALGKEIEDGMQ